MKNCTLTKGIALNVSIFMGILISILWLLVPTLAEAAKHGKSGQGYSTTNGHSGQGGSGKGASGKTDSSEKSGKGDLYGDLVVIVRDDNGEPIKFTWDSDYTASQNDNGCEQPIAQVLDDEEIPEGIATWEGLPIIPLDADCEMIEEFSAYSQEVEFGRLSVARTQQDVLDRSYDEAMSVILADDATITLDMDPAGRIRVTSGDETTQTIKTIDSPLENLAMYQVMMKYGCLRETSETDCITSDGQFGARFGEHFSHLLGNMDENWDHNTEAAAKIQKLDIAAALLAAAGDKSGAIGLDVVINTNTFLGINVLASSANDADDYFDFNGYQYARGNGFKTRAYLLQPVQADEYGVVESAKYGSVLDFNDDVLPALMTVPDETGQARGFTQIADDSLKMINYIHNWELPELADGLTWK